MKSHPADRAKPFAIILLFLALIFGSYVRIYPILSSDFPINDGGMFYEMTKDLLKAGFQLPETTSYNQLTIPYAYPPLAFYAAGLIAWAGADIFDVLRWLPALLSILTIPALFWLARIILQDDVAAAFAAVLYALIPRAFEWLIMGGGLTRAPGMVFFLLFSGFTLLVFKEKKNWALGPAILFGGLILLTHPERSLHAAVTGAFIWLFYDRSRSGLIRAAIMGVGVIAISALWWGPILARSGIDSFLQVLSVSGNRLLFWAPMLLLNFTDESTPLIAILAAIGFLYQLSRRDWFLPLWITITFLVEPRSAVHMAPIQVAILAAVALKDVLFASLANEKPFQWETFIGQNFGRAAIGYILILSLINSQLVAVKLSTDLLLSTADRQALEWARQNTPENSRFLVYTWIGNPALSPLLEWFPVLSQRMSLSTYQGREWLSGAESHVEYWKNVEDWNGCLYRDAGCITSWMEKTGQTADFVYFALGNDQRQSSLSQSLLHSEYYSLVYQTDSVWIFQHMP